jgi:hypothetical protein
VFPKLGLGKLFIQDYLGVFSLALFCTSERGCALNLREAFVLRDISAADRFPTLAEFLP